MKQLSPAQHELVLSLVAQLAAIPGINAVVLGGSHARGLAHPESDIDLGILYSEAAPFCVQTVRELADRVNDTAAPVVTDFYQWGHWVNGGAWLTIRDQRSDLIYRNLDQVDRVISDASGGRYELDYAQQPPFGFFSGTYLGEIVIAVPLFDPESRLDSLKARVTHYPESLRRAVVQDYLWAADFGLAAFARKFALREDAYGTSACLARAVNQLVLVLFALNRRYLINDKTALAEVAELEHAPRAFGAIVQKTLANVGTGRAELIDACDRIAQLLRQTIALSGDLYRPRYVLP